MKTPKWLMVTNSMWYGTTVHTMKSIPKYHVICRTKIENFNRGEGFIKTPEGNLFHHTANVLEANCVIEIVRDEYVEIIAKKDLHEGDELLINYDVKPHKRYDFHDYSIH